MTIPCLARRTPALPNPYVGSWLSGAVLLAVVKNDPLWTGFKSVALLLVCLRSGSWQARSWIGHVFGLSSRQGDLITPSERDPRKNSSSCPAQILVPSLAPIRIVNFRGGDSVARGGFNCDHHNYLRGKAFFRFCGDYKNLLSRELRNPRR